MRRTVVTSFAALATLALTAFAYAEPPNPNSSPPPAPPAQSNGASEASSTRLAALVPQGMSSEEACKGFSSATDCALVLHIAQNLNISFADLKGKLASGQSLPAALSTMKPGVDPQAEITKAEAQARSDVTGPG
jgi:hypothetical protein